MKKSTHIPTFNSDQETALFFDTHDSTEFLKETTPAKFSFPKPSHKVVVEIPEKQWQKLLKISSLKKVPYTRILESFISKQLVATR